MELAVSLNDLLPVITFFAGAGLDHFYKKHSEKQKHLEDISSKFRVIIETLEQERYSKSLLIYDYNNLHSDIIIYCRKYKVDYNLIKDDLTDLAVFTTIDTPDKNKISNLFSSINRILKISK